METKETVLVTTLPVEAKDNFGHSYKMHIMTSYYEDSKLTIKPEGKPAWYLDTFMQDKIDRIAIDYGQNWFIINKREIMQAVENWLGITSANWKEGGL